MKTFILFITAILILTGCRNPSAPETDNKTESENDTMWQTPKKDWTAADAPLSSDANRWESNTEEAYNLAVAARTTAGRYQISGNLSANVNIPEESYVVVQTIRLRVEPNSILYIVFTGFALSDTYTRLKVDTGDGSDFYQSSSNNGANWLAVEGHLFSNSSQSAVYKDVRIMIANTDDDLATIGLGCGWLVILQNG